MNNLWSYCGLVDATISASEKDLPVSIGEILTGQNSFRSRSFQKSFPIFFSHLYCTVCRDESRRPIGAWEIADEIILPPMPPPDVLRC